ncbi:MAG: glutamate racemase [Gammaproteobacteria bacterium]|nr:glutamate racemase [Gammaproteobacteria bacterium]
MTIGVFDSGVGGLSVLKHLKQQLNNESFIYVADSANAPYGDKTEAFIQQRCLRISEFLSEQQVSAIVVACNTATAAAVKQIREALDIPVVAIEPALKPASLLTKTGKIGVLATMSTLQSKHYNDLLAQYTENVECYEQAAHGLVEQVEAGLLQDTRTLQLLQQYLQPMIKQGVDCIVLGCTHYPFLMNPIEGVVGKNVTVIETGAAIAERLKKILADTAGYTPSRGQSRDRYFSSSDTQHAKNMIALLMGLDVEVEMLPV